MTVDHMATATSTTPQALDVPSLARELRLQLQRYIEAQYPIRHPSIVAERHALLEAADVIAQEPFIESTPGYVGGPDYCDLALSPHLTSALAELASWSPRIAVPARLYQHQATALEAFLDQDRDLIVATGTGSGKTGLSCCPSWLVASRRPGPVHIASGCLGCAH